MVQVESQIEVIETGLSLIPFSTAQYKQPIHLISRSFLQLMHQIQQVWKYISGRENLYDQHQPHHVTHTSQDDQSNPILDTLWKAHVPPITVSWRSRLNYIVYGDTIPETPCLTQFCLIIQRSFLCCPEQQQTPVSGLLEKYWQVMNRPQCSTPPHWDPCTDWEFSRVDPYHAVIQT